MRRNALRFMAQNIGWLTVSLVLAALIWVAAMMANNPVEQDEVEDIPIEVLLPQGFVLAQQPDPNTVVAVVRAEKDTLGLIDARDVLISADLSQVDRPGDYRVVLEAEIASPLHGKVVSLDPSSLVFAVDRQVEELMAIQVAISREPPLGYTYPRDLACDAAEVLVIGSAEKVADVARVEARLNLGDDRNPVTKTANLVPVRRNGLIARSTDIQLSPASVECFVDISVREGVVPVEVLPNRNGTDPPSGYIFEGYAEISPRTVGVTGDTDAITAMNNVISTEPIDLTDQTATFTTEVPLALPEGVSLVTENQVVRVTVIITAVMGNREFQGVPLEVTGLDMTLFRATGLANTVTVNVVGPQSRLPELTIDNLSVTVDLRGLPAGNHQVQPTGIMVGLSGEEDITISSILPEQLSVTIEAIDPTVTPETTATPAVPAPAVTPTLDDRTGPVGAAP